jgi:RNA polymerase sigma-70 factor (ECF subfamily)
MATRSRKDDECLVKACVSGSEEAWTEFYNLYIGLVRSVVKRKVGASYSDIEDLTQNVFIGLISSLKSYDSTYPLTRFISIIAERTCIQEYRKSTSAKRSADTDPIDLHDGSEEGVRRVAWTGDSQEDQLEQSQLVLLLRDGLRNLGEKCRNLLKFRYYEDRPFKEIARMVGANENTVTVQSKRCLDKLRGLYHERLRKGKTSKS